jgi:hypothetical protein
MTPPLARTVWPLTQWPAGLTRNAGDLGDVRGGAQPLERRGVREPVLK